MRKMRKGFTLIELLVVIAVMGILGTMAMISGQEATDAARANNIADGLEKAAAAMMMYYSDNADSINESGTTVEKVRIGANAYLKTKLVATSAEGKYSVSIVGTGSAAKWYAVYKFLTADANLKAMIANKATRLGLYSLTTAEGTTTAAAYAGTESEGTTTYPDEVAILVR